MMAIRKLGNTLALIVSILPILWAVGLLGLAFRARKYLGYWPGPNHPDPQFVPFDTHYDVLAIGMFANLIGLVVFLLFRRVLTTGIPPVRVRTMKRIFLLGWFLILSLTFIPNISFVGWFLD